MQKKYLVTGAAGFIGSHFAINVCESGDKVVVLDKLSYAGNLNNLSKIANSPNFRFVQNDICNKEIVSKILNEEQIDYIVNFAAESHVDNSIKSPFEFIQTNIVGTFNLLDCALKYWQNLEGEKKDNFRFLHVSTDEVFGSLELDSPKFNEENPYKPNSPYSASKASSDHLVRAWFETYNLPVITTNCSNNFGPHQHQEKLIPTVIRNAVLGNIIPIYGNGKNIRDWIYVVDHANGIYTSLHKGRLGESYCFGGECEKENIDIARKICEILDEVKPLNSGKSYKEQIKFVQDRLGHDKRYAIDNTKVATEFGFAPSKTFEERLKETVIWYLENRS